MPPKPPKASAPTSSALVPVGARHVQTTNKRSAKRDENGDKPTTARALILRNGKYGLSGPRGPGELMVTSKLLGREKLDLLAEDLVKKSQSAVMNPFRLSTCLKIADSQCSAFLDDIANLQDPVMFVPLIEAEWASRIPSKDPSKQEPLKSATAVAKCVAAKIHNTYLFASAWKIVADTLHDLEDENLSDSGVTAQLQNAASLKSKYLFLYHFVEDLLKKLQEKFSVLATTTSHYAVYFKARAADDDVSEEEIVFDWNALKQAGKSYLDSILLEICFPSAPYPLMILLQLLSEAIDESPKEAKRFPQALWDALGDLSVCVELRDMLEAPLLTTGVADWKKIPVDKTAAYNQWLDAAYWSEAATEEVAGFKDIIFPLAKARKKEVLDNMWKSINLIYKGVSGKDIDTLWQLQDALTRTPQWHSIYIPGRLLDDDDKGGKKKKVLAITTGEESDDSMPSLQSVSNSSEDDDSDDFASDDDDDDEEEDDSDEEYDEEQEDEIRDQVREAMDTAHEGDLFDRSKGNGDIDPFARDDDIGKGNAFLKLLGSLRGRVFNPSPKVKVKTGRPAPRNPKTGFFGKTKTGAPAPPAPKPAAAAPAAAATAPKSKQATVEEVDDEDDKPATPKKKKKKPKKKKKKASTPSAAVAEESDGEDDEEAAAATPASAAPSSPPPPAAKKPAPKPAPSTPVSNLAAQMSTVSLATSEATAQSAHSYLKSENLLETKSKVKSRGDALPSVPEKEKKRGFMSKFGFKDKPQEPKKPKQNLFARLSKKATESMHQLLRTAEDETKGMASMKWETFLKLMREMGFSYDPTTAGSSVRFDPPDPKDVSITFHKPHPDTTIHPVMLRKFAQKLKKSYGWSEAEFLGAAAAR